MIDAFKKQCLVFNLNLGLDNEVQEKVKKTHY